MPQNVSPSVGPDLAHSGPNGGNQYVTDVTLPGFYCCGMLWNLAKVWHDKQSQNPGAKV